MIKREKYLNKLIKAKDTEFIKVITGVRRCGKSMLIEMYKEYLLESGVDLCNILHLNFESHKYVDIKNSTDLYDYIKNNIGNGVNYILLDEVQVVESWEKAVNALNYDLDVDIYITGSNAYLLSGELHTLLSGRYLQFKMYPLSFSEFLDFNSYNKDNIEEKFDEYLKVSGLPAASKLKDDDELLMTYINDIYNTIVKKDIMDRNNVKNTVLLEKILLYLVNNVGSSISSTKISDYLNSNKVLEKTNHQTIDSYLKMLENSFIIYKADRLDVKSKEILKTLGKYYLCDLGIRNMLIGYRNIREGHALENLIYLELLRRGYKVSVGKSGDKKIDFVAQNMFDIKYIQVSQSIYNEDVFNREVRSLELIDDNYEKIILTMDKTITKDIRGIKVINIIEFLLNE